LKFLWNSIFLGLLLAPRLWAVDNLATPVPLSGSAEFDLSKDESVIPPPPALATPVALSPAAKALPLVAPPANPATPSHLPRPPLVSAEAGNRVVQLGWYPSEGGPNPISGYLVFRGTDPAHLSKRPINRKPVTAPEFLDSADNSLSPPDNRVTYYYGVRAVDEDARVSPMSNLVAATPNGPLLPPGKLSAAQEDGRVVLSWSEAISSGLHELSAYLLYRSETSGSYGEPYAALPLSATSFTDALPNGKPYYYRLRSLDSAGNSSEASPEIKASAFKPVKPPTQLTARGVGDQAIVLKWQPSEGKGTHEVAGYNVYRSTRLPVDLGARPINKAPLAGATKFDDEPDNSSEPPKLNTLYHYQVVALDSQGNPSPPSAPASASPTASLTGFKIDETEIPGTGGTTLSIQGQKTIDLGWRQVTALNGGNPPVPSGLEIKQKLRVNLTGKVGRKIKVDVDYDDTPNQGSDNQKISVVYTGDQQEVFKEFAFGDVLMDLGAGRTEWAGYSKHLFGAKMKLASPDEKFRLTAIGAQTKGYTETKRILGGLEQAKSGNNLGRDFLDSSFQPYHYYYLSREKSLIEGPAFIKPGTVDIWYDQNGVNALTNSSLKSVPTADGKTSFSFRRLVAGSDYTVDVSTGLVTFNIPIQRADSLAVAYTLIDAGNLPHEVGHAGGVFDFTPSGLVSDDQGGRTDSSHHLIQYGKPGSTPSFDSHMSFQFYNLGNRDILNPQLDPDFKLVIYGGDQKSVYELNNRTDFSNVVQFDTRLGLMEFRVPFPFQKSLSNTHDLAMDLGSFNKVEQPLPGSSDDVYNFTTPTHNYTIHVEFKYKVANYNLRPGIIRGSELITLDGRKLTRDADYYLDYDFGQLLIHNPDLVKPDSVIEATYEYLPFGGQFTSTIWGVRGEYDLANGLSLGSTFLMNSSDAPLETPEISSTPFGVSLLDADAQFMLSREKVSDLLAGLSAGRKIPFSANIKSEVAHSSYSPNTFSQHNESGVAMIDGFESVDNIVSMSVDENGWSPSSRPITAAFPDSSGGLPRADRQFSKVVNESRQAYDAEHLAANENPQRSMLAVHYDGFTDANKWDSFVTQFAGTDNKLSEFDTMEMLVYAESPITINIDLGQVNEDADDNGQLDYESTGVFAKDLDVGTWTPANSLISSCPGGPCYPVPPDARYVDNNYWGAGNNVIDTEDSNHDGVLNFGNSFYRLVKQQTLAPNQWNLIRVRLKDAQIFDSSGIRSIVPGNPNYYANLYAMRMWWSGASAPKGTFYVQSIQFKGNKWQTRADPAASAFGAAVLPDTDKIRAEAINAVNSGTVAAGRSYVPNTDFFRVQVEADKSREQGLQLDYQLTNQDQTLGRPNYSLKRILTTRTSVDFGNYLNMRVDIFKPLATLPGEILLVRLGVDDLNYFEYHVYLDAVPSDNAWHTQTFALDGSDGKRSVTGHPYLRSVNFVSFAILTYNSSYNNPATEFIWLDNLRVTDAQSRNGTAYKINVAYDLAGLPVTEDYREIDSDFVQMDRQDLAPGRHAVTHALSTSLEPLKNVPLSARWETRHYFTESKRREDPLYSHTFVDPDEAGQILDATLGFKKIPRLDVTTRGYLETVRDIYLPTYVVNQRVLMADPEFLPHSSTQKVSLKQDYSLAVPEFVPVLKNDQVIFSAKWDRNATTYDKETAVLPNFKNVNTETGTLSGRYTGQYKPFSTLSVSPSYAVSQTFARGNVQQPVVARPYYTLTSRTTGTEFVPQYMTFEPALALQLEKMPLLRQPRLSYKFSQTWDFIAYEVRTPGSLELSGNIALNDVFGAGAKIPELVFSQQWGVDSTVSGLQRVRLSDRPRVQAMARENQDLADRYGGNVNNVPNPVWLDRQSRPESILGSVWWVRAGENENDPYNIENIASNALKRQTTNLSTTFDVELFPGWKGTLRPRGQYQTQRTMAQAEQVTGQLQWSAGGGYDINDPAIPFSGWYNPGLLQLTFDFLNVDNDDSGGNHVSNSSSNDWSVSLPRKAAEAVAINLRYHQRSSDDTNFVISTGGSRPLVTHKFTMDPQLTVNYVWRVDKTMKLWDIWPFNGRELKIKQSFELYNTLGYNFYSESRPTLAGGDDLWTKKYELTDRVKYNVLENVEVNFTLLNQMNESHGGLPTDNYQFGVTAGVAAKF
jgi:hypothetical protein